MEGIVSITAIYKCCWKLLFSNSITIARHVNFTCKSFIKLMTPVRSPLLLVSACLVSYNSHHAQALMYYSFFFFRNSTILFSLLCFVLRKVSKLHLLSFRDLLFLLYLTRVFIRFYDHENWKALYLTIIPRARMGCDAIAHEAEGRMGYWLRGHEGEIRGIIVLVKSN